MKRVLSILVAVVMLVGVMCVSASAATKTYIAPVGTADIDGVVSAGEWDAATAATMDVCTNPGKQLASHPTMKIMNDGTYMYVLVESNDAPDAIVNIFVCAHVAHDGCELDGCKSYIKFVVDGQSVQNGAENPTWTYYKDSNWDGKSDFEDPQGGKAELVNAAYSFVNGRFIAELKIAVNYGNPIPEGKAYVDVRADFANVWATHQWTNQQRTWDPTFNPAWDAGEVTFASAGGATQGTTADTAENTATGGTTANEPTVTDGNQQTPETSDAGLAIAAVAMAAAAMVVLTKKHR